MTDAIDWLELVQQFQWLFGAIAAAGGAFFVQWRRDRSKQIEQRRTVAMLLATQLRNWMVLSVSMLQDIANADRSDGEVGHWHSQIPDFEFESNLEQVAQLSTKEAERIFNLVHKKGEAHSFYDGTLEFVDWEEASDGLKRQWAQLLLECLDVYRLLASPIGWSPFVLPEYAVELAERMARPPAPCRPVDPAISKPAEGA